MMMAQVMVPVKNLDHLLDVLSSDPACVLMVFIIIITFHLFVQPLLTTYSFTGTFPW